MDYYDARQYAGDVARNVGICAFGIVIVFIISLSGGVPPLHAWLAAALLGVAFYAGMKVVVLILAAPRAEQPEPVAAETPVPVLDMADEKWTRDGVNWLLLLKHLHDGGALSRSALVEAGVVNQRTYSPIDGAVSFPERMVELGAALRYTNGGAPVSYIWTSDAKRLIRERVRDLANPPALAEP